MNACCDDATQSGKSGAINKTRDNNPLARWSQLLNGGNLLWVMEKWNTSSWCHGDAVRSGKLSVINKMSSDITLVIWNELLNRGNLLWTTREWDPGGWCNLSIWGDLVCVWGRKTDKYHCWSMVSVRATLSRFGGVQMMSLAVEDWVRLTTSYREDEGQPCSGRLRDQNWSLAPPQGNLYILTVT